MKLFEYRYPRFSVDLPAQFSTANETLAGRCTDISTAGMRLESLHAVAPGSYGKVSLRYKNQAIDLNARVAHTDAAHSGLEFLCGSAQERAAVARLVASLKASRKERTMFLMPRFQV